MNQNWTNNSGFFAGAGKIENMIFCRPKTRGANFEIKNNSVYKYTIQRTDFYSKHFFFNLKPCEWFCSIV